MTKINTQVKKLKAAADARSPDHTLTPIINQLIQTLKTWQPSTQSTEANLTVAYNVRNLALHLWNEHQKLDFATQITNALISVFNGVHGMEEANNRISEDLITLYSIKGKVIIEEYTIEEPRKRTGTGCLLQIVIFAILALIGALLQGC